MDPQSLNILVCPTCKVQLYYDEQKQELICKAERLAYPIQDGIPVMLSENARHLSLEECKTLS